MTPPRLRAVALSRAVRRGPVRVVLDGAPIVLFRTASGLAALEDRCPHRGAPLSRGRVTRSGIVCPYHGWRFGGDGVCTAMPAREGPPLAAAVPAYAVAEQDGVVFAGPLGAAPPRPMPPGLSIVRKVGTARTTVPDLAENILDTTHTQTVHAGWLRRASAMRLVQPVVEAGPDWIAARYPASAAPSGLAGFLSGGGYAITDRFEAPGVACVTYVRNGRVAFAARFHLTPADPGRVRVVAVMGVPTGLAASIKLALISAFMRRVYAQDTRLLEAVSANLKDSRIVVPEDLLRRGIEAIAAGRPPKMPTVVPRIYV